MLRTTVKSRMFVAGTLLSGIAGLLPWTAAKAAEDHAQLWTILTLEAQPADRWVAALEINPRARSDIEGGDALQTRATLDYRIAANAALGGGLLYAAVRGGNETRPHQQITIISGPLAFRTRLEERFFAGAERMEVRLRQRVQATLPLARGTSLVGSGEIYGVLRSRRSTDDAKVEQLRANFIVRHQVNGRLTASAGYLLIMVPRSGDDGVSHVAQIGATFHL